MTYDLVIRNGTVVDGSGRPGFRADVAIRGDRIARIGRVDERGDREIDAEGHVVTPGFIDGHTHMDAQLFWDPLGTCSSWHGVTSVVMGNCGFTLAPSVRGEEHLVLANLERAEDIPAEAMAQGIEWTWDSFPSFLGAVDAQPKAINYAAQVGHSALRTAVMGERAFSEQASEDDFRAMSRTLAEAMRAGAVGFTTSISDHHWTSDGRPVASRIGSWEELCGLVGVLGQLGVGVFELATDTESTEGDLEPALASYARLRDLAVETRVPVTYGLRNRHLEAQLALFEETAAAGGRMYGQCRSGPITAVWSFLSGLPMDRLPAWRELRGRPLDEQRQALREPSVRRGLIAALDTARDDPQQHRVVALDRLQVVEGDGPWSTVAELAHQRGARDAEHFVDLALQTDLRQVFVSTSGDPDEDTRRALGHPWTVTTFSDAGAHVSRFPGTSVQTGLLADWVRGRQELTLAEAVRMLSLVPALIWGLPDRGLLRVGAIADVNVFDPATVALAPPTVEADLPGAAIRAKQQARGYLSTVVGGQETFHAGEHTGALPGRLIRGPLASG